MKKYMSRILTAFVFSFSLTTVSTQTAKAQDITVSYQSFYDNLSPYGQWVYDADYGNVWVPNEDGDFRPYGSRGHWLMTEYGNTWVSEDPWGWAVYHYGRWTYNPYYGWVWIPGYEWAPAWVSWRFGGGYAGWAPLGPGVNMGTSYYAPDSWWIFVGPQYMYQPNCIRYWYGPSYNTNYIYHTTIINNYYVDNSTHVQYNYGPRAEVIQQVTRQPVKIYRVSNLNRPGAPSVGRNSVGLYRPAVNRASFNDARPDRVVNAPRPIGRSQQPAPVGTGRPAFRQEVQHMQPEGRTGNGQNNTNTNRADRFDGRNDNQPNNQPGRYNDGRQVTPQPGRSENNATGRNNDIRPTAPTPGRFDNRNDNNPQPQPGRLDNRNDTRQPAPAPGRFDNRNDNNPQPQPGRLDNRNDTRQPTPAPGRQDNRNDARQNNPQPQPGRFDNRQQTPPPGRNERQPENKPQMNPPARNNNAPQPAPQPAQNAPQGEGRHGRR